MKLIGGCLPHAEEGYEVSNQVCIEWAICVASVALLEVNLMANLTVIKSKRFGDGFYEWTQRNRQESGNPNGLAQLPRPPPPPPLRLPQTDLWPPEPELVYDTPAAGPNYTETLKTLDQASSSPRATSSSTFGVDPPTSDSLPVQPNPTRPQQSTHTRNTNYSAPVYYRPQYYKDPEEYGIGGGCA
ncbi:hypothetical protein M407DRAFT_91102 [Tulasnella calospora MUT 4182]|uniref:Uncharacterized protein n=1 Tax=Tulasnella calospora MUT 4182 TaxID=1051891 RepID=A0A0C3QUC7_9AGAM|nr:hypothetical protein M407DRAFT_91102 [Tulasnella calospora MUT 4182]